MDGLPQKQKGVPGYYEERLRSALKLEWITTHNSDAKNCTQIS